MPEPFPTNTELTASPLYSEDLGNVTVDPNGVYAFQFGAAGNSDILTAETLATTDGTTATYQKTLTHTPLPDTLAVADGTFSWNITTGNPGAPATATATIVAGFVVGATLTHAGNGYTAPPAVTITGSGNGATATATVTDGQVTAITITSAGSGYFDGATIAIAPPPAPFTVNFADNTVTATYRYSTPGIAPALAAGAEQWLELTVDGVAQTPRQKILAVPFAVRAGYAEDAIDSFARQSLRDSGVALAAASGIPFTEIIARQNSWGNEIGMIGSQAFPSPFSLAPTRVQFPEGRSVDRAISFCPRPIVVYSGGFVKFGYSDGTDSVVPIQNWGTVTISNPNPEKLVLYVETSQNGADISEYGTHYNHASLDVITKQVAGITFNAASTCEKFFSSPQTVDSSELLDKSLLIKFSNLTTIVADWNQWIQMPPGASVISIEVRGKVGDTLRPRVTSIKVIQI